MSVAELYQQTIRSMPPAERLQLASLILSDLAAAPAPTLPVDESDEWSDEDMADATRASIVRFDKEHGVDANTW